MPWPPASWPAQICHRATGVGPLVTFPARRQGSGRVLGHGLQCLTACLFGAAHIPLHHPLRFSTPAWAGQVITLYHGDATLSVLPRGLRAACRTPVHVANPRCHGDLRASSRPHAGTPAHQGLLASFVSNNTFHSYVTLILPRKRGDLRKRRPRGRHANAGTRAPTNHHRRIPASPPSAHNAAPVGLDDLVGRATRETRVPRCPI